MAAQGGGESVGRSGLVPVAALCYLLLRVVEARELVRCLIDA
ncbi:hypothetical protein [Corynebacterium sp. 401_CJEI]|nr:hypothetical protein [Corynebacterium sp. 401_CJEI]